MYSQHPLILYLDGSGSMILSYGFRGYCLRSLCELSHLRLLHTSLSPAETALFGGPHSVYEGLLQKQPTDGAASEAK